MTRFTRTLLVAFSILAALAACASPLANAMITVDTSRCIGCGECEEVCPYGAIEVIDGDAVVNPGLCHQCNRCIETCPEGAIY
ncbi:MAG TPA: 4Fe-4S binding protein [Candidatus Sabulitectum sp.]|nr:4Fe-4S binding protein [Candidatus Sabulitectum sp.]HPF33599.1 4Fe-4S binding protein [Candidatus Sabulitectum sp.]HPR23490.1 4Fe-4S binding protein [Candidatus Sabulitectum sp.]